MKKNEKIRAIRILIVLIFALLTKVTIESVGWAPLLALAMALLLFGEHKINGAYRARARAEKKEEKARHKNARRSAIHTSKKVIPFNNNTITIIDIKRGFVKCV